MVFTPTLTARSISETDLLFPCTSIFWGSIPPASATANSPPVQTSIPIPHSFTQVATAVEMKAFAA